MADQSKTCLVDGCNKRIAARGLCWAHYMRLRNHGDPLGGRTPNGDALAFIEYAILHMSNDCLLWPYLTDRFGYGLVFVDGKRQLAHHVVCERVYGLPPTPKHEVAHGNAGKRCTSKACINPNHLRWATHAENMSDSVRDGTSTRGEKNPASKLTEADVLQIFNSRGIKTKRELAETFGVSKQAIDSIHDGVNWSWLTSQMRG